MVRHGLPDLLVFPRVLSTRLPNTSHRLLLYNIILPQPREERDFVFLSEFSAEFSAKWCDTDSFLFSFCLSGSADFAAVIYQRPWEPPILQKADRLLFCSPAESARLPDRIVEQLLKNTKAHTAASRVGLFQTSFPKQAGAAGFERF